MTTFTLFAALTNASGAELDNNFTILGEMGVTPCTIAGTNAQVFTVAANVPAVSAYVDYASYAGIAAGGNTGAATAKVGTLAALNIYKDGPSGPTALVGGEIVAGNYIALVYDSALNSGAGGFHLITQTPPGDYLPLSGGTVTGNLVLQGGLTGTSVTFVGATITSNLVLPGALTGTSATFSGATSVGSLDIAAGSKVTRWLSTTSSIAFTALAPGASADSTIALTGASVGDIVNLGMPASISPGIAFDGRVAATGVVSLRSTNGTSGTVTPYGGIYRVSVVGFT